MLRREDSVILSLNVVLLPKLLANFARIAPIQIDNLVNAVFFELIQQRVAPVLQLEVHFF
ncbi:hypothetical protein D3C73_922800 [compost metagenome]